MCSYSSYHAAPRDQEGLLPSRDSEPSVSRTCIERIVPPSNVERYKGCRAQWLLMRSRARAARTLRPTPGPTSTAARHLRSAAPPAVPSPCALARLPTAPRWRSRVSPVLLGLSSCGCVICFSFLFGSLPQRLLDLHHLRSSRLVLTPFLLSSPPRIFQYPPRSTSMPLSASGAVK